MGLDKGFSCVCYSGTLYQICLVFIFALKFFIFFFKYWNRKWHKNSPNEHVPLSIFFSSIRVDASRLCSWRSIYFFVNEFLIFLDLLSTLFFYQMNWNETRPFLEHCQFKCSWHILLTDCARSRRHARVVIPDHRHSLNENVNGPSRIVEFSPSVHTCIHFFFQFMKRVDFFFLLYYRCKFK